MESFLHLAIIWCSVYVAVFLAHRTRLTPVLYYLAIGAVLVNVHILPHEPTEFIRGFAEFGIILIMFALGFEENTSNFVRSLKRSWGIAFFGALAPFTYAFWVAKYLWGDTNLAIMCGLAMTATAVSLTMVVLKGVGLHKTRAATGIMTSAILDDIASLLLVAILIPIAAGQAEITAGTLVLITGKALTFFIIVAVAGLWLFPHNMPKNMQKIPLIGRFGIKHMFSFGGGAYTILGVLLIAVLGGVLCHYFGFHPAVGAYMAGLILKEEYFHFEERTEDHSFEAIRDVVDNIAFTWIGPVFFVVLGTQIVFDWDVVIAVLPHIAVMTLGLFVVQIVSAGLAARYTGGFSSRESVLIGFGMLGRAELCFVVLDIAYVQYAILTTEAFFTLMATAFWLNIAVPLTISFWKAYLAEEKPA